MGRRLRQLLGAGAGLAALLLAAPAQAREAPRFGFNDITYNQPEGVDRITDLHRSAGADLQRVVLSWRGAEREPGRYELAAFQRSHDAGAQRGIDTLVVLGSAPAWAAERQFTGPCSDFGRETACQQPPAPHGLEAFGRFVREVVSRFPRVVALEVWNEPNSGGATWQPQADPEYYARVQRVAYEAVKAVRPEVLVISGGIGGVAPPPYPGAMPAADFLRRAYAAGAKQTMDAIGVHPYPAGSEPDGSSSDQFRRQLETLRAVRDAAGDHRRPLWITEVGYTTAGDYAVTEAQQRDWLSRIVHEAARQPDIGALMVHTLREDVNLTPHERGFGLLRPDLSPKPAWDAVRFAVADVRAGFARAAAQRARRAAAAEERRARRKRRHRRPPRCRIPRRCVAVGFLR